MTRLLLLAPLVLVVPLVPPSVAAGWAAEQPARSRLCPDDLPEGVRLPPQPGCGTASKTAASKTAEPDTAARKVGIYDLGDGTTLRVGGRASAAYGGRR